MGAAQFYGELGKFLYALALADGFIQPREVRKLEGAVSDALKGLCGKYSARGEAILARLQFQHCIREQTPSRKAEESFLDYVRTHGNSVDSADKKVALALIRRVSAAYGGVRVKESLMEQTVREMLHINHGNGMP